MFIYLYDKIIFMSFLILSIFIIWYLLIAFEHNIWMNKTKWALFFWTLSWIIIFIYSYYTWDQTHTDELINEIILEIAELSLFLISAMTIVSYLSERKVLEKLATKIIPKNTSKKKLLFIIWIFTFFFSSIADNLTAALVSVTILLSIKWLTKDDIIRFIVFIIFSANVWWVALITWDITTLMIFLAWKVTITHLIILFIPSFIWFLSLYFILNRKLKWHIKIDRNVEKINTIDITIFSLFIITILLIIILHILFHIPPYLIFLFWLSIIFILTWFHKRKTKEDLKIVSYLHRVEFDAIFFFIWILLMVWSLDYFHLLNKISTLYEFIPMELATFLIWITSSIVDNIPLTAAMLKWWLPLSEIWWLDMTYAVWSWWSLLIIWSAAWIIAMSKYKEITFGKYLKFLPQIFIAYSIWYIATLITTQFI